MVSSTLSVIPACGAARPTRPPLPSRPDFASRTMPFSLRGPGRSARVGQFDHGPDRPLLDIGHRLDVDHVRSATQDQLDRIVDSRNVAALLVVPAVGQIRRQLGQRSPDADQQLVLGSGRFEIRPHVKPARREARTVLADGLAVQKHFGAVAGLVYLEQRDRRQRPIQLERPPVPERLAARIRRPQPRLAAVVQRDRCTGRFEGRRRQVRQSRHRRRVRDILPAAEPANLRRSARCRPETRPRGRPRRRRWQPIRVGLPRRPRGSGKEGSQQQVDVASSLALRTRFVLRSFRKAWSGGRPYADFAFHPRTDLVGGEVDRQKARPLR